ncbi:hypothetical protein BCR42DRAFT_487232 [Absidia repens]|uniref:Uncharacterized protein n=1 Tax=Absidia repens TaxID=90262 RepID=A0A1X2IVY8_9FUNG|nr:hypothetical protein BCR42DRAFT_487232 [Absidia repens]
MTHLSDFSFLQRMVSLAYLSVWFLYRVWKLDRFQCLAPSRFRQGELKSVVTALILVMIPFQLYYDVISCKIKYEEGFASIFGHVYTKPEMMWTKADQELVVPTNYSLCIGFSLQTGTLLLLQCFWRYLANSVAKASFMSSREFLFYIIWTFVSVIIFPVLQYNFSRDIYDPTYKEIMPELVYGFELLFVACLGVVSHFRFRKLLNNSRNSNNARSITNKIRYFQELNLILTVVLFIDSIAFIILSVDGLTGKKTLNAHKFSADFLICNINISTLIVWFLVMLIFHPKPQGNSLQGTQHPTSDFPSGAGKPTEGYVGSPPTMMTEASQASSDYLQYTKSVGVSMNSSYTPGTAYQLGPLPPPPAPPPPENMRPNISVASTTPSTATLVTPHYHSSRNLRSNKAMAAMDPTESMIDNTTHLPPYRPTNNNNSNNFRTTGGGISSMEPILSEDETTQRQVSMTTSNGDSHSQMHHGGTMADTEYYHQPQERHYSNDLHLAAVATMSPSPDERQSTISNHYSSSSPPLSPHHHHHHHHHYNSTKVETNQSLGTTGMSSSSSSSSQHHSNWQIAMDFCEHADVTPGATVKREDSADSLWLHQSPRSIGGSSPSK